ncbi:MAG: LysR family transcriptional regulator [Roseinatronobacter sp.]
MSVAEHGSIQRASREVGIAASAIDRQIIQLEAMLNVQLFERQPSGMSLTLAGERFVLLAKRWNKDAERLLSEIKELQGIDLGIVRVAMMDSQVNGLLPICIARLARDYPRIRIDVDVTSPDAAPEALERGDVDIAVVFNLRPQRDLHVLWTENLPLGCVVAPDHALAQQQVTSMREVVKYPLALQSPELAIRQKLEKQFSWLLQEANATTVTNSLQLIKHLARRGEHVALTSEIDAAPELLDGSLVFVPIREQVSFGQSISILVSTRRPLTRISRIVANVFCEEAGNLISATRMQTRPGP